MARLDAGTAAAWNRGSLWEAWRVLGAHRLRKGVRFTVWAPAARSVRVTGEFCGWSAEGAALSTARQILLDLQGHGAGTPLVIIAK